MQYIEWPDHGVPENPRHFIEFMAEVRRERSDNHPIIVHCSAGIGRTGVQILMETALCMIEANEPIWPAEILETMRAQRALLIQTAVRTLVDCLFCILRSQRSGSIRFRGTGHPESTREWKHMAFSGISEA